MQMLNCAKFKGTTEGDLKNRLFLKEELLLTQHPSKPQLLEISSFELNLFRPELQTPTSKLRALSSGGKFQAQNLKL